MKKTLVLAALTVTLAAVAFSQSAVSWKPQNGKTITTAWDTTTITSKEYQQSWIVMDHDSGSADVWIAWQGDSSHYGIKIPQKNFPVSLCLTYAKWFKVRADTGAVRLRWIIMNEQPIFNSRNLTVTGAVSLADSGLIYFSTPQPVLASGRARTYVPTNSDASSRATTSWDSLDFGAVVNWVQILKDSAAATDTLWVALQEGDTSAAYIVPIYPTDASLTLSIATSCIRTKTSVALIRRRVIGF